MTNDLDYLGHLARESARFAEAVRHASPDTPVESCPDWRVDDLLWHLGEVQWFWGTIVREKVTGPEAEELKPSRPADRGSLFVFYDHASRDLGEALAAATPDTHAWTWHEDQTVGFIRRRQAHEALIHRIDAELAAGVRTPMDPQLSADGVDEALRVMYGGAPPWGTITPEAGKTLRFQTTDTGDSWFVTLGQFTGTDPKSGTWYSEPDIDIAGSDPGGETAALIRGGAADLNCWLWHRPAAGPIERSGDRDVLGRFEATIAEGIN